MNYKGFEFYFDDYVSKLLSYNKEQDISFSICLTEIQCYIFDKIWNNGSINMLIQTMKWWIDDYLNYKKQDND